MGAAPRIGDPRAADLPADLAADVVEQLHRRHLPEGHRPVRSRTWPRSSTPPWRGWCFPGGNNPHNQCSAETKTEVFSENRLVLDVGKMYWGKAGLLEGFVGYRYWYNKFGTDHNAGVFTVLAPNTSIESTAFFGTTYHFTN